MRIILGLLVFLLVSTVPLLAQEEKASKKVLSLFAAADKLEQQNEYASAIGLYDLLLDFEPKNSEAFYRRGIVHGRLGKFTKATEDYNLAVEINDDNADKHYKCLLQLRLCKPWLASSR